MTLREVTLWSVLGFPLGNFFWQVLSSQNWAVAAERSFLQVGAILVFAFAVRVNCTGMQSSESAAPSAPELPPPTARPDLTQFMVNYRHKDGTVVHNGWFSAEDFKALENNPDYLVLSKTPGYLIWQPTGYRTDF